MVRIPRYAPVKPRSGQSPGSSSRNLWFCPFSSPWFCGQKDVLKKIKVAFERRRDPCRVFVLYGLAGSGKTQVAMEFASGYHEAKTTLTFRWIFHINARRDEDIRQSLYQLRCNLQLDEAIEISDWMKSLDEPWLLIFDNANSNWRQALDYLADESLGYVIVTSRDPEARTLVDKAHEHRMTHCMEPMKMEAAMDLFYVLASNIAFDNTLFDSMSAFMRVMDHTTSDHEAVTKIVKLLHCLPLAVEQAAHIYRRESKRSSQKSYDTFYTWLRRSFQGFSDSDDDWFRGMRGYGMNLHCAFYSSIVQWNYSTRGVGRTQVHDNAETLLRGFACLDCGKVDTEIFRRAAKAFRKSKSSHEDFLVGMAAFFRADKHGVWEAGSFESATQALTSCSLICSDQHNQSKHYSMHPLLHEWAWRYMDYGPRHLKTRQMTYILAATVDGDQSIESCRYRANLAEHIRTLLRRLRALISQDSRANAYDNFGQRDFESIGALAQVMGENGHFAEQLYAMQMAIEIEEVMLSGRREPWTIYHLAVALRNNDRIEAAQLIIHDYLKHQYRETNRLLYHKLQLEKAQCLMATGEWSRARSCLQSSINDIHALAADKIDESLKTCLRHAHEHLAEVENQLENTDQAIEIMQDLLTETKSEDGKALPNRELEMYRLTVKLTLLRAKSDPAGAIELAIKALDQEDYHDWPHIDGPDILRCEIASARCILARDDIGDREWAVEILENTLERMKKLFGPRHSECRKVKEVSGPA